MLMNEPELAAFAGVRVIEKMWGKEFVLANNGKYCLKFLKVNPGFQSSIHCHKKKDETFIGWAGTTRLTIHAASGEAQSEHAIHQGQSYRLKPNVYHSFQAYNVSWILEVSTAHEEKDVVRLQESRKVNLV
jgi:D-lyxose ketol-isomerase